MPTATNQPVYHQFSTITPVQPSSILTTPESSLDPFVHATDIPNLCLMPSGPLPPNPPELLDSKAMQRLFTALASCGAEIVIFDTPSLLGLSDASILASRVDGTLVVVDITRTNKGSLKQVKALLEQARARVLGCIVNKQRYSRDDTTYSYHYYGTDGQNNGRNHRVNNVNSLPVLPITPEVLKEQEIPSQPDPIGQNDGKDQRTSNVNSPAVPADALDASDQTIKLPRKNRRKDEQSEDG
jgi:capsular exopolysaccharide synthesis family protein